jgi:hypothetical protein
LEFVSKVFGWWDRLVMLVRILRELLITKGLLEFLWNLF